ncbi:MAG: hypothetical protein ICV66_06420, partial [Chitinophagaceae bacterium]|nr:hypothetical protein [Chitinophagaceae bacterium]
QTVDLGKPLRVLDLCGAPGGKSTHIQTLISPDSLLVSNEIIKSRSKIIVDNIVKWGAPNVVVTNNDPVDFQDLPGFFDVVVVDAPCSGSGLFRKAENAIQEWSQNNVVLCSQRQQRILADVLLALKQNGILIYSTCSYSKEEDEDIADWLVEKFRMENVNLEVNKNWGIVESYASKTKSICYRFYPDKLKGEGFYLACFRKGGESYQHNYSQSKVQNVTAAEKKILTPWIKTEGLSFYKKHSNIFALPQSFTELFSILQSTLQVIYAGIDVGEVVREKFIPHHALALSTIVSNDVPSIKLNYADAIKYLQKQNLQVDLNRSGWQLVSYQDHNLGWVNALHNRINNYYPKELRILKRHDN